MKASGRENGAVVEFTEMCNVSRVSISTTLKTGKRIHAQDTQYAERRYSDLAGDEDNIKAVIISF